MYSCRQIVACCLLCNLVKNRQGGEKVGSQQQPFHYCGSNVPGFNSIMGRLFFLRFHSAGNWSFVADLFTLQPFIPRNNCSDSFVVISLSAAACRLSVWWGVTYPVILYCWEILMWGRKSKMHGYCNKSFNPLRLKVVQFLFKHLKSK